MHNPLPSTVQGYYVYLHIRADQNPRDPSSVFYVGKGCRRRAWTTSNRNPHWRNVVAKRGFLVRIIEHGIPEPQAYELEEFIVSELRHSGIRLTNQTAGGDGTPGLSLEAAERKRIGISRAKLGKPISQALRDAISRAHKGRIFSEDHRKKISDSSKGRRSQAQLDAARAAGMATAKPVVCIETGMEFESCKAAQRWLVSRGMEKAKAMPISRNCRRLANSAYGYTWQHKQKSPK